MEALSFNGPWLAFQAKQLAQKPKRQKIADYIGTGLMFVFLGFVLWIGITRTYVIGSLSYNYISFVILGVAIICGTIYFVAHHFPFPVKISKNEISQATGILLFLKETDLRNEIHCIEEKVNYTEKNLNYWKGKLLSINVELVKLYQTKELE
ncbi:MAG: hypothetical protein ACOYMB_00660 [Patescibacteria group bacterium]